MPDEKKPGFFQRWGEVRQGRKEQRKRFRGEYNERSADLSQVKVTADYRRRSDFYADNPGREGESVAIGTVDDQALRWSISWLPATTEVIALADNWIEASEQEHVPEAVYVLGRAADAEVARAAMLRSYSIETMKDALAG